MRGVLSGVAGPQPGGRLEQLELVDAGHDRPGVAQQLVHRARPHRGVGAALLDGGADDDRAVAAGHQVDRAPVHQAAHGAAPAGGRATPRRAARGAGCAP